MGLWTAIPANPPSTPFPAARAGNDRPAGRIARDTIRVLVVDDDDDDRLMIRRFLSGARSCHFQVEECSGDEDVDAALKRTTADVILMDQRLGRHSGTDLIRRFGGNRATIPAILLTGSDDEALEEEAIVAGAAEHLNKADLSTRVLERTIKYVVKWHGDQQELRRQGEQLQMAWSEAARANRAKSVFLASMSHELRTPLNAIIGFSSMLLDGAPAMREPPKVGEYAAYIRDGGEQLLHLVNNLLDIARIEAGQFLVGDEELDLAQVLRSVVRTNEPLARKRSITIRTDISSKLPMVRSDPAGLQQIFLNLLSNATKYTLPDGRATVTAARYTDGVRVRIHDTGIGMTDEEIGSALRPFMRNRHNAYVRSAEGTGLGLAIVTTLVEQLDLAIDFESRPGRGTTVTVTIPPKRVIADTKS